jgi:predicted lipid-binding transport protein (Tim44 family)
VIDVEPIEKPAPAERWKGVAEPGTPLAQGLDAAAEIEPNFDVKHFLNGAKAAYEAIVMAFASGDRSTLKDLLSRDVFENFSAAIAEREKKGETVETTFVSLDKAVLQDVQLKTRVGQMTVRFESQLITVTRDANGKVIDGATDKVVTVNDVWTFARELGSRDPVWRLIATETA